MRDWITRVVLAIILTAVMLFPLMAADVLADPIPPVAAIRYLPAYPLENMTVSFDASLSRTGESNISFTNFEWDFGDGSPKVNTLDNVTLHAFVLANYYTVTLNVTDSQGLWNTTSTVVTVSDLVLTVGTSKPRYDRQEIANVGGSLTWIPDDAPVMNALVGVEIRTPADSAFLYRTRPTSYVNPEGWPVNFLRFYPCDQYQNPKYSFMKGEDVWILAEWKNFDSQTEYPVKACISVLGSGSIPIGNPYIVFSLVEPFGTALLHHRATEITSSGILGVFTVYASLFSDLPKDGGYPYCPEGTAQFTISLSGASLQYDSSISSLELSQDGSYDLSFGFWLYNAPSGNYTVYASSYKYYTLLADDTMFTLFTLGDINGDDIVDIFDAILLANAFDSTPGDPRWNPKADFNVDNLIDIFDAIVLANQFT